MKIFDAFERIYIINLPERTDRMREVSKELARAGLRADDTRIRVFPGIRPADAGVFPSRGAHGCHMSHLGIIREAIKEQLENVLIIEDDVALSRECLIDQPQLVAGLRNGDWDFAYPGHTQKLVLQLGQSAYWTITDAPLVCAHFYALHRRILPALEEYLASCMLRPAGHPDGGPMHIDGAYSMFRARHAAAMTLIATPSLAGQRSSRSDIYANRWFDRLPVVRSISARARRLRNCWRQYVYLANTRGSE
jgi:glycosyl transferase family 25